MEIKVVCSAAVTSGINDGFIPGVKICGNLKDAFWFKDYLEQGALFEFTVSVILQTAHRAIEVKKEHPHYRVVVDGWHSDLVTDDFTLAMARCMIAWSYGYDAIVEHWKEYDNGVTCWKPLGEEVE